MSLGFFDFFDCFVVRVAVAAADPHVDAGAGRAFFARDGAGVPARGGLPDSSLNSSAALSYNQRL